MSYTHLSSRWVNIRKPRRCFMCNTKSDPPARMRYSVGVYEGDFTTSYACEICESYMTAERWKEYDYEISEGDIWNDEDYKPFRDKYLFTHNHKKMIKKVTLTGADDSVTPADLLRLSQEFPFVEWGILISGKRFGTNRFPSQEWLSKLKDELTRATGPVKLAAHLCGQYVRDILMGDVKQMEKAIREYWLMFERVQINTHGEPHEYATAFFDFMITWRDKEFILQYDNANQAVLIDALRCGIHCSTLFDISHGAGIVPNQWPQPFKALKCGYAGGLSPENLEDQIYKIGEVAANTEIWIDMETKLRSNGDALFDLEKCRRVLEIAKPYVMV